MSSSKTPEPASVLDPSIINLSIELSRNSQVIVASDKYALLVSELKLEKARWEVRLWRLIDRSPTNRDSSREGFYWTDEELKILAQMKTRGGGFGYVYHTATVATYLKRTAAEVTKAMRENTEFLERQIFPYEEWWAMKNNGLDQARTEMLHGDFWKKLTWDVVKEEARNSVLQQSVFERQARLKNGKDFFTPKNCKALAKRRTSTQVSI